MIAMLNASLRSLLKHTSAPVDVLCFPLAMCRPLGLSVPSNVQIVAFSANSTNWVLEVELAKLRYCQEHVGASVIYFEIDMIFLQDPTRLLTSGFDLGKPGFGDKRCDAIIQYCSKPVDGLHPQAHFGGINTGFMYLSSNARTLHLLEYTVCKLRSMRQITGGTNQLLLAEMGFKDVPADGRRTIHGYTICSKSLYDNTLLGLYDWRPFSILTPINICSQALAKNVSIVHFNGDRRIKSLLLETAELLESPSCIASV